MAEDLQDLQKSRGRKQYKWVPKKGKYVFANVDERGRIIRNRKGLKGQKTEAAKRSFKEFKKRFGISYQEVGERENRKVTQRAKDLFVKRRKEKFWNTPEDPQGPHQRRN